MFYELDAEDAKPIIAPFFNDIFHAIKLGFEIHSKVRNNAEFFTGSYSMPVRTRADLIRMKFLDFFIEKYEKRKVNNDIRIISNEDDLVLLVIQDILYLRFNKLDNKLNASLNETQQSKDFLEQQLVLPELMPKLTGLILGYTHNIDWTQCNGIYVKKPRAWAFEITETMAFTSIESQNIIDLPQQTTLPSETIIKSKIKDADEKYGTS